MHPDHMTCLPAAHACCCWEARHQPLQPMLLSSPLQAVASMQPLQPMPLSSPLAPVVSATACKVWLPLGDFMTVDHATSITLTYIRCFRP